MASQNKQEKMKKLTDKLEESIRYNEHLDSVRFDNDIDLDKKKNKEQLGFEDTKYPDNSDDFTKDAGIYYGRIDFLGPGGIVGETIYFKDKQSFDKEVYESGNIGRPIEIHVYKENKKSSITERMAAAKERSTSQTLGISDRRICKGRGER